MYESEALFQTEQGFFSFCQNPPFPALDKPRNPRYNISCMRP